MFCYSNVVSFLQKEIKEEKNLLKRTRKRKQSGKGQRGSVGEIRERLEMCGEGFWGGGM